MNERQDAMVEKVAAEIRAAYLLEKTGKTTSREGGYANLPEARKAKWRVMAKAAIAVVLDGSW